VVTKIIPRFFLFLLLTLSVACVRDVDFRNKDKAATLDFEKMKDILCDVQLAEAVTKDKILKRDSFRNNSIEEYYSTILTSHEVSEDDFERTLQYYIANPVEMQTLFYSVESRLRIYSKVKLEKKSPESSADVTPVPVEMKRNRTAK